MLPNADIKIGKISPSNHASADKSDVFCRIIGNFYRFESTILRNHPSGKFFHERKLVKTTPTLDNFGQFWNKDMGAICLINIRLCHNQLQETRQNFSINDSRHFGHCCHQRDHRDKPQDQQSMSASDLMMSLLKKFTLPIERGYGKTTDQPKSRVII